MVYVATRGSSSSSRRPSAEKACGVTSSGFARACSRFESLILSHHSRFTCKCNKEDITDDDDDQLRRRTRLFRDAACRVTGVPRS